MSAPMETTAFGYLVKNERFLLDILSYNSIFFGVVVLIILGIFKAPYGRYASSAWGFLINPKLAWFLQEIPCILIPAYLICLGESNQLRNIPNRIIIGMFIIHYIHRSLIYPFLIKGNSPLTFASCSLGTLFCCINGYLQTRYHTHFAVYDKQWIMDPRFLTGVVLFFSGMAINIQSDQILRNLRKPGETGYKIPKGGMFEYVSGANFFGETLEWFGFALASWSLQAFSFFVFTITNIGWRAVHHHRWYQQKFEDYPKSRRAFIPFVL